MKTKRIKELEEIIENAEKKAEVYRKCKDGSFGAAFDYHGGYEAQKELEELEHDNMEHISKR